jgi:DNA-binding GntR family transcriptional regulator
MEQSWQPAPLATIQPLVERTHEALLEAICDGRLPPGARLTQEHLAELLGVSRQPISHALVLLKQQGFVRDAAGRGLEVVPVEPERIRAVYQVRAALEDLAAGAAAARARREPASCSCLLAQLDEVVAAGQQAAVAADPAALLRADIAFHTVVAELSGNPVVLEIAQQQLAHIRRGIAVALEDPAFHRSCWDEHVAIAAAIRAGRAEEAARLARAHCEIAGGEAADRLMRESESRAA